MTLTNKEIVQGVFAELAKGNGRPFVDSMADDFSWTMPGNGTWSGTWRGKQAVREQLLGPLFARFEGAYTNEAVRIVCEGDIVVVEGRGRVITKAGTPYNNNYCFVFRLRDGKLRELTEYMDTELAAQVLGPQSPVLTAPTHEALRSEVRAHQSETDAIRAVIERYFLGHAKADADLMRQAFWPSAHVEGVRDGKFSSWTLDAYCALFNGSPADDEAQRQRSLDSVDVSGSAATARATLRHGPRVFIDYFVLLRVNGEWRIANKVYHAEDLAATEP
jgi:uncharacterized protein